MDSTARMTYESSLQGGAADVKATDYPETPSVADVMAQALAGSGVSIAEDPGGMGDQGYETGYTVSVPVTHTVHNGAAPAAYPQTRDNTEGPARSGR